jgi:uncharacterized protein (TIGR03086 family)
MTEIRNTPQPVDAHAPSDDPRQPLAQAIALAGQTLREIRADQYGIPTPCTEYTVGQLARHLIAAMRRIALAATGGDPSTQPPVAEEVADGEVWEAWTRAAHEAQAAWADPAILTRMLTLPFGTMPGAAAAVAFTGEFTLHTWDLAQATGLRPEWDPAVVAFCASTFPRALPAEPRGGQVPFGPVIEVPEDATDLERLLAWSGRRS